MIRVIPVIVRVLMIAGIMDTLSLVYFQANRSGVILGIPWIKIYPTSRNSTHTVINAASPTSMAANREKGCFL